MFPIDLEYQKFRLRFWYQLNIMPAFKRPHLKVEQPKSAFAEGNARWYDPVARMVVRTQISDHFDRTNKDLDPVPRHQRKWGVTSLIAYWISDAFKYECLSSQL